jgi:large subunit ribosomal protein L6
MSRIGKQLIQIPPEVKVKVKGNEVFCQGPRGDLSFEFDPRLEIELQNNKVLVSPRKERLLNREVKSLWGTTRSVINNMVLGVASGFEKKLEINGVGYTAQASEKKLILNMGYSHPVEIEAPEGIEFKVEKNIITVSGFDKQLVGQIASRVRAVRKSEPYKGKGIKYIGEHIRRKAGKKAVATEGEAA